MGSSVFRPSFLKIRKRRKERRAVELQVLSRPKPKPKDSRRGYFDVYAQKFVEEPFFWDHLPAMMEITSEGGVVVIYKVLAATKTETEGRTVKRKWVVWIPERPIIRIPPP